MWLYMSSSIRRDVDRAMGMGMNTSLVLVKRFNSIEWRRRRRRISHFHIFDIHIHIHTQKRKQSFIFIHFCAPLQMVLSLPFICLMHGRLVCIGGSSKATIRRFTSKCLQASKNHIAFDAMILTSWAKQCASSLPYARYVDVVTCRVGARCSHPISISINILYTFSAPRFFSLLLRRLCNVVIVVGIVILWVFLIFFLCQFLLSHCLPLPFHCSAMVYKWFHIIYAILMCLVTLQ